MFSRLSHDHLSGLHAADKVAGHDLNKKGFKVIKGFSVIQGDGIDYTEMKKILNAVLSAGYSAQVHRGSFGVDRCFLDVDASFISVLLSVWVAACFRR